VDYVNAFALPAGTIFVTAPLILMASNEAEMAGVIGHEIGHVTARHTAERINYMEKNKTKNLLYTIGGGILGGASGYGLGKLLCPDGDKECLAKAAGMGAVAGAGGSLLIQKYKFMANSREDEMEADRIGFRVAVNAGYSKADVGKFFEKLLTMEKKHAGKRDVLTKAVADVLSTHPPSEERVQQMKEMAMKLPSQVKPIRNTHEFTQTKDRVRQFINSKKK
jgi:predicted Zn-dependent protease